MTEMPKEYSVDDILAEVLGDRATRKPASKPIGTVPKKPAEVPAAESTEKSVFKVTFPEEPKKPVAEEPVKPLSRQEVSDEVKKFVMEELKNGEQSAPLKFPIDVGEDEPENEKIEDDEIDDFESYSQKDSIFADLRGLRNSIRLRIAVTAVCSVLLAGITFLQVIKSDWNIFFNPNTDPIFSAAISLVLMAFSVAVCYSTFINGLSALFHFKANSDTLPAMLPVFCALQLITLMLTSGSYTTVNSLFAPLAALALLFNSVGKQLMVSRIASGFAMVSDEHVEKYACDIVGDARLTGEMTKNLDLPSPLICISRPTNFLSDFIKNSYAEDSSDSVSRFMAPIVLIGSLMIGVINFFFTKNFVQAIDSACAAMALATPFASTICCNLPLLRANRKAAKRGGMVAGMTALDTVGEASAVYFDCAELFNRNSIFLHHFETFGDYKIDDCIIDAASITKAANIPLCNVFMKIIQDNARFLKQVDSLTYEDEMGLSAWVGSKRILLGNRELLRTHGIDVPSREFEAKYKRDGREIVYLANSGELAAFFVVSYNADPEITAILQRLSRAKISVLVKNCDCNITARKLTYIFNISDDYLEIVPKILSQQCDTYCAQTMTSPAKAAHSGGLLSFISTLMASIAAKNAVGLAVTLQVGSMILGFALVSFFTFVSGLTQINFITALVYQAFWLLAISVFPNLRKY